MSHRHISVLLVFLLALGLAWIGKAPVGEAVAQALSGGGSAPSTGANIRATRHNLSSSAPSRQTTSGNLATTEAVITADSGQTSEVCIYCHTPHAASTQPGTPLWNRTLSAETYTPYTSSSLQASDLDVTAAALAAPSKLCLSCHDGTLAIGSIENAPGVGLGSDIQLLNTDAGASGSSTGRMPYGRGQASATHGFTRRLGTDLRNDHPISFTFDATLATADGELRNPASSSAPTLIADRSLGVKPDFPLTGGKMQCTSCHDPHKPTQKFLNKNRLAVSAPETLQSSYSDWSFSNDGDQICVGCHTRMGKAWAVSSHANSGVAGEAYKDGDAAVRDFPTGTKVWQAGCLNCHDTHTVGGSRRLLREGVGGGTTAISLGYAATIRSGSGTSDDYGTTSALENTCYQCHSNSPVITPTALSSTEGVPNIENEFSRSYRMPITTSQQGAGSASTEVHDITDADLSESQTQLGYYAPENRHVECTDCHNPHRVVKADTFLGGNLVGADTTRRTHVPARGTTGNEGNIASGALRGAWGVEPSYTATGQSTVTTTSAWMSSDELPTYTVKKGDPGSETSLPVGTEGTNAASYLTREYQLCFKCHSNNANGPLASDFPWLGGYTGATSSSTNSMTTYTNVAAEYAVRATDPPSSGLDQGEMSNSGCCDPSSPSNPGGSNNHRSWHPVVFPTGRTKSERGSSSWNNVRAPFNTAAKIGYQTMQCSDCHGSAESWTQGASLSSTSSGPNLNQVQGPHGSGNPFILKGIWTTGLTPNSISGSNSPGSICGRCHDPANATSGFAGSSEASHGWEVKASRYCMFCHVAVPHGWKNKAFLVNLNCVQTEGGSGYSSTCTAVDGSNSFSEQTIAPYYNRARLRISSWAVSGNWAKSNCVGEGWMSDACGQ